MFSYARLSSLMRFFLMSLTLLITFQPTFSIAESSVTESSPGGAEDFVQQAADRLIATIAAERKQFDANPQPLFQQVGEQLDQTVDFASIARGVMGSYYKDATADQRSAFQKTFRTSLIQLYTRTLVAFESKSIQVAPAERATEKTALVAMQVESANNQHYTLVYNLARLAEGWRIRNMIVDGVNLGMTYRSQFTSMMNQCASIDAAIQHWRPVAIAANAQQVPAAKPDSCKG